MRALRTILFAPGDRLSAVNKALSLPRLDVLVVDLEDAVGVNAKEKSRDDLLQLLPTLKGRRSKYPRVFVRINCPLTSPWGEKDLESIKSHHDVLDGVVIPKVEASETLEHVAQRLGRYSPSAGIWAMIETALGVERVGAICQQVACSGVILGSNDLTRSLGATFTPDRSHLMYAMQRTINAARAYSKPSIDGVYMSLDDDGKGLEREARQGRALGFDGKTLIHPKQIDIVNAAFSPTALEVETSKGVIGAFQEAVVQGKGVAVYKGRLIEALHVEQARDVLALHESLLSRL